MHPLVFTAVASQREPSTARPALIRLLTSVRANVRRQIVLVRKPPIARPARVRLLSGVRPHMHHQALHKVEAFSANFALERSPQMNPPVLRQVALGAKTLSAHLAHARLFSGVRHLVRLQILFAGERLAARLARERPFPRMDAHVPPHILFLGSLSAANFAHQQLFGRAFPAFGGGGWLPRLPFARIASHHRQPFAWGLPLPAVNAGLRHGRFPVRVLIFAVILVGLDVRNVHSTCTVEAG